MATTQRLTKRQQNSLQMRAKIYDTAIDLFKEYGYEAVKITEICEKAGVSIGTFYRYYETKDHLIQDYSANVDSQMDSVMQYLTAASPVDKISQLFLTKITFLSQMYEMANNAHIVLTNSSRESFSPDRKFYQMMEAALSQGVSEGLFRSDISIEITVNMLNHLVAGLYHHWLANEQEFDIHEKAKAVIATFLTMIKA